MLVLSRRLAEILRIGDDIEITILGVSGNQVRLGIVAPRDVAVDREEIYQRKKEEASGAAQPAEEATESDVGRPGRGNHPYRLHARGPRIRH